MSKLKYLIPIIAGLIVSGFVWATFPTALNNWQYNDTITEDWANSLETTIGITNSADTSSHDYLIRDRLTISYASTTYLQIAYASSTYLQISSTTPYKITSLPNLTITEGQISNLGNYLTYGVATSTYLQIAFASSTYYLQREATSTMNYWETKQIPRAVEYLTYPVATSTYLQIAYASTTYSQIAYASTTFLQIASTTPYKITSLPNLPFYPAFTYSTTSWSGTTTVALGVAYVPETWIGVMCFTNAGNVAVRFGDGTNKMDWIIATTTVGQKTLSTNNTFTAQEARYVEMGSPETAPTMVSCTIRKNY